MASSLTDVRKAGLAVTELQIGKLISLPLWLEELSASLIEAEQPDETGRYRVMKVLPERLIPDADQSRQIAGRISHLQAALATTPSMDTTWASKTTEAVSKMMMVLAGRETGALAAAAKGEAYMMALTDIPFWAVEETMRKWYRRECDTESEKFDYRWMPDPGSLRAVAFREECRVRHTLRKLQWVSEAKVLIEYDDSHRERMLKKMSSLLRVRKA